MRNGFIVDFGACARAPGFDAQRLRRPDARQLSAFREGGELFAGNNAQVPFVVGTGMRIRRCAVVVAAFDECRPRVTPDQGICKDRMDSALFPARVSGGLDNGVLSAHILNIDAKHEFHAIQVVGQRFRLCTFDDEPERLPVLDGGGCIFDASLRGKQQKFAAVPRFHTGQDLGCEGGEPAGAVGAGDPHDAKRGTVHNYGVPRCGSTVAD